MKERAISPIIATVILVAVTIALAVGVALWFSGIIGGAGKT
ncbi:MAG: archaellin/type IV pilin N-terminal domain-containing protein, partial [Fervidicoccaceae archaeon]